MIHFSETCIPNVIKNKSSWTGRWMTGTGDSRKRHNIEKSGVVEHLDLPRGRWPEEEEEGIPNKPE